MTEQTTTTTGDEETKEAVNTDNNSDASAWDETIRKAKRHTPNLLSLLRILLVPFFVVLLIRPTNLGNVIAAIIFVVASLTDWLDGYLARAFKAESIIGKMMDTIADKVLVTAALVMLSAGADPRIPPWMTVALLARELIVTGLRSLASLKGMTVSPSSIAKHKTAWQMVAIIFLLINGTYSVLGSQIDFNMIGTVLIWIALVMSIVSAVKYFVDLRNLFDE